MARQILLTTSDAQIRDSKSALAVGGLNPLPMAVTKQVLVLVLLALLQALLLLPVVVVVVLMLLLLLLLTLCRWLRPSRCRCCWC